MIQKLVEIHTYIYTHTQFGGETEITIMGIWLKKHSKCEL